MEQQMTQSQKVATENLKKVVKYTYQQHKEFTQSRELPDCTCSTCKLVIENNY